VWSLSGSAPQIQAELKGHTDVILDAVFLGDRHLLATASFDGTTRIWKLSGETVSVLRGHDGPVFRLSSNPEGNLIASASQDGTARLWPVADPVADPVPSPIRLSLKKPTTFKFSNDGQWLFAGGAELSRWNLNLSRPALSRETRTWSLWVDSPSGSAISPNGRWFVDRFPNQDGDLLTLWDFQKELSRTEPVPLQTGLEDPDFVITNDWLIFTAQRKGGDVSEVQLWNLKSDSPEDKTSDFGLQNVPVTAFDVTASGSRLAIATADDTVRLIDLRAHTVVLQSNVKSAGEHMGDYIHFSPRGKWLIFRGNTLYDGTVRLWKLSGNTLSDSPIVLSPHTHNQGLAVTVSSDDRILVTRTTGEPPLVWNLESTDLSHPWLTLPIDPRIPASANFSPDGRWLVTTSYQEPTQLWDLSRGKSAGSYPAYLRGHVHPIVIARFTPDSHWLITADTDEGGERETDKTCRLWDLQAQDPASSAVLLPKDQLPFGADDISVSLDGRWLITLSVDGVRLWHLGTRALIGLAQVVAGRDFSDDERRQYDLAIIRDARE
jgi:WD40 repeat protein